jgi:putative hydrolase of the HAD superfamily
MIQALIFDLDDTLYCESDFVASGYRAVAQYLSAACGQPSEKIYTEMMTTLACEGKKAVMPTVLERYQDPKIQVADLVDAYRRHKPEIQLFTGYAQLLRELRATYRIGIITDGIPAVQRAKCAALGLEDAVDSILYTWDYGPEREKPHPYSFRLMLIRLQVQPSAALFIGDSLEKDCRGAHHVGMRCVRVQRPLIHWADSCREDAEFVIESLLQLPIVLKQLEDRDEAA